MPVLMLLHWGEHLQPSLLAVPVWELYQRQQAPTVFRRTECSQVVCWVWGEIGVLCLKMPVYSLG